MGTPKATAPDHMFALSVGPNTIRPCAQMTLLPQPLVLYVAENTRRAIKNVLYTNIYSKHGVKPIAQTTQPPLRLLPLQLTSTTPVNTPLPYKLHPVPAPEPPPFPSPSPYSYISTHHQQPIYMAEQLSTFLNEFKTVFGQLIQQNGLILNMLSTVVQKITT